MSTKATITYDDDFHFYHECFDDENVYLRLDGAAFEASNNRVTVAIPLDIWEAIRGLAPTTLDLSEVTDKELRAQVETEVEELLDSCRKSAEYANTLEVFSIFYGLIRAETAEKLREKLLVRGMKIHRRERNRQRTLATKIKTRQAKIEAERNRQRTVAAKIMARDTKNKRT